MTPMGYNGKNLSETEDVLAGSLPLLRSPSPLAYSSTSSIMSPCAACKILRRKCGEKCVLAPYFPPTEPTKFAAVHRVFGAGNIIKFLQEIPKSQKDDAVSSMVYEASARIRDPVYGCAGAICQLQKQINELHAQLAMAQAEISGMRTHHAQLMATLVCAEMDWPWPQPSPSSLTEQESAYDCNIPQDAHKTQPTYFTDINICNHVSGTLWESLWE